MPVWIGHHYTSSVTWHREGTRIWVGYKSTKENLGEVEEDGSERCKSGRVYDPRDPSVFSVNLSNSHLLLCLSLTLCDKSCGHSQWEMRKKGPSPRGLGGESVTGEESFKFQRNIPTRLP